MPPSLPPSTLVFIFAAALVLSVIFQIRPR
jgi:hypothetical protein